MSLPPRGWPLPQKAWILALAVSLTGCFTRSTVVRIEDGRETEGAYISPESYAAMLDGALAEAAGRHGEARKLYERAVSIDSDNATAWARLGLLLCGEDRSAAERAIHRALDVDAESLDAWLSRAECALRHREFERAARSARRAVAARPTDRDANLTYVLAETRAGRSELAERWRRAFALFAPRTASDAAGSGGTVREAALDAENDEQASRAAMTLGISGTDLAMRAIRRGNLGLARTIADRVLAAEPDSGDALVAVLSVADLEGNEARFAEALKRASRTPTMPGPLAARLLAELLERRAGAPGER